MLLSNSAIQTIAAYYPNMRREPRCQHALTVHLNAVSMDDLNARINQYSGRILHVTLHGGDVGRMVNNEHVDVFLTIIGVKHIGEGAFWGCSSLTSVTFPSSLITIGKYAFEWCRSLKTVTFPSSLLSIGFGAFHLCTSLRQANIPASMFYSKYKDAFPDGVQINRVTFTKTALRF